MPRYTLLVNGKSQSVQVDADTPLLYVLRDDLALKGPKFGCGLGQCGACTVHVNGVAATEFRTFEREVIAQYIQQWRVGIGLHRLRLAVNEQCVAWHGLFPVVVILVSLDWFYSAVMPAVLIVLAQNSVSRLTSASSSVGGK